MELDKVKLMLQFLFIQLEAIDESSLRFLPLRNRESQLRFMIVTSSMALVRCLDDYKHQYENTPEKTLLINEIVILLRNNLYEMLDQILSIKIDQNNQISDLAEKELRSNINSLLERLAVQILTFKEGK